MNALFACFMLIRALGIFGIIIMLAVHIALNVFLKEKSFMILQIIYYGFSCIIFLYCLLQSFVGCFSNNPDKLVRRYYCAIKYPMGAEMFSWLCSVFMFHNFVYAIALCVKTGIWYPIVLCVIYFLIYNNLIGPRLNPYLFLADRAKQGDYNAAIDLQMLNTLKITGAGLR